MRLVILKLSKLKPQIRPLKYFEGYIRIDIDYSKGLQTVTR